jgi:hypothetical protein
MKELVEKFNFASQIVDRIEDILNASEDLVMLLQFMKDSESKGILEMFF